MWKQADGEVVAMNRNPPPGLTLARFTCPAGRPRSGPPARLPLATFASAAVLSLGIPLWVVSHNADTQSHKGPGGLELTANQQHGREVFAQSCATCHTLAAANAVGRVGPDLDQVLAPLPMEVRGAFVKEAIQNGRAGKGQMPADLLRADDRHDVVVFLRKAVPAPPPAK